MKYSILGFNQEEIIKISELDLTDLLLLQYIKDALASPTMQHKMDETEINYVWLCHSKILEDLPILKIKESMLFKRLKKLCELNLIKSMQVSNTKVRGSKVYYTITEKCECLYMLRPHVINYGWSDDHNENITCDQTGPDVINYVSSNKQLVKKNNKLKNNINNKKENFEFGKIKEQKQSLYSKCIADIESRNYDRVLHHALIDYLQLRLQMKDKPLYANSWKGLLNKLEREFSEKDRLQVVYQSIERGYASFFPISTGWKKNDSQINKPWEQNVRCTPMTDEEKRLEEIEMEKLEAQGIKMRF